MHHLITISCDPSYDILAPSSDLTCTNRIIRDFMGDWVHLAYSDILTEFQLMDNSLTIRPDNPTILGYHANSASNNPCTQIGCVNLIPQLVNWFFGMYISSPSMRSKRLKMLGQKKPKNLFLSSLQSTYAMIFSRGDVYLIMATYLYQISSLVMIIFNGNLLSLNDLKHFILFKSF